jgi:O-acetylhomoserine/O-acetylserine sulfhydrylase-like pyridoxal-dependent enzyme
MSAIVVALLSVCNAGDTIIAADAIYGGTYALLADFMPAKCGITTVWVDAADTAAVADALAAHPGAKALYAETLSNPTLVRGVCGLCFAGRGSGGGLGSGSLREK